MSNYIRQTQDFLLELIHLYSSISQLLHAATLPTNPQHLLALTQALSARNCIDRGIRRENQLRLFRETETLAQKFASKPLTVRRSDLIIKVNLVCQVLEHRLKEQLIAPPHLKAEVLRHIRSEREAVLQWAAKAQSKPSTSTQKKETQQYVLKYAFTDQTRPTSSHPSQVPRNQHDSSFFQEEPSRTQVYHSKTRIRPPTANLAKSSKLRANPQRKTEVLRRPAYYLILKSGDRSVHLDKTVYAMSKPELNDGTVADGSVAEEDKENGQQVSLFKKIKKCMTIDCKLEDEEEGKTEEREERQSSKYYISQKYIKSKKNIESAFFASKIKKKSQIAFTKDLSSCGEPSQETNYHISVAANGTPRNSTSKIFFARHAATEFCPGQPIKSQKLISKEEIDLQQCEHKTLKRSERKDSQLSQRSSIRSRTSVVSVKKKKESQTLKPSRFCNVNLKIDQDEAILEVKPEESPMVESSLGDYYLQLASMREDITSNCDDWLKDFSVFFWQQQLLSEEANRKIQKIISQRKEGCLVQQFEMRVETSQKSCLPQDHFEDAFMVAMRQHLTACKELGQAGLCSD